MRRDAIVARVNVLCAQAIEPGAQPISREVASRPLPGTAVRTKKRYAPAPNTHLPGDRGFDGPRGRLFPGGVPPVRGRAQPVDDQAAAAQLALRGDAAVSVTAGPRGAALRLELRQPPGGA